MATYAVEGSERGKEKKLTDKQWATIWFGKLAGFCKVTNARQWTFSQQHVIDYLITERKRGVPTWKRIKIVESLLVYSKLHFGGDEADLGTILIKLRKLQREEPTPGDDRTIDEIVGRINPAEPDVIQEFRRSMRLEGIVHP